MRTMRFLEKTSQYLLSSMDRNGLGWDKWERKIFRTSVGGLVIFTFMQVEAFGQVRGEIKSLYEEAQRHHLGIDRPKNLRKAYELYQNVIGKDAYHVDSHYNLANICIVQKRYDLAEKFYQKVITLHPRDADAYNNLGAVYEKQGLTNRAKISYQKAVQVNPELAVVRYNLARLFLEEGNREEALVAIDQALKINPEHLEFLNLRARILGETGRLPGSTAALVVVGFVCILIVYALWTRRKGVK